jgi:hypothetical protein
MLLAAFAVALPSAVAISYVRDELNRPPIYDGPLGSPFLAPGVREPDVVAGDCADLPDDEPVIGVDLGSRSRAYVVAAMAPMANHVVNDVLADHPLTVTYCNKTGCVHAFTGIRDGPLDVWVGGFMDQMMLRFDGRFFWQNTGKFVDPAAAATEGGPPLVTVPHTLTTWGAWRKEHPQSDVYLGG